MAKPPELTDEQVDALLAKAAADPQATEAGFHPPQPALTHHAYYFFSKDGAGDFLGDHSTGDGVSYAYFREAVAHVLHWRGNIGNSRAVADAYWDVVLNPPEKWTSATALTLCQLAPLQGVLAEQAKECR